MDTGYLRQLDGLRALAVGFVVFHHYKRGDLLLGHDFGRLGVFMFFSLSGFLITRILLQSREGAEQLVGAKGQVMRSFYARRALRIFPLYYGALAFGLLAGLDEVRQYFVSLVTYTFNFALAINDEWLTTITHFWSLAVEEQFYLVWPLVVLFVPRRRIGLVCVAGIVAAPAARALMLANDVNEVALYVLPIVAVDALLIGALLAVVIEDRPGWLPGPSTLRRLAIVSFAVWAAFPELAFTGTNRYWWVADQSLVVLSGACLVAAAVSGVTGFMGTLLQSRLAVFLGRISYGIYVIHLIVPELVDRLLGRWQLSWIADDWYLLLTMGWVLITIGAAWLSWTLFESRFNSLKSRFPYLPKAEVADRLDVSERG